MQSCVTFERELILAREGLFDEKGEDMVFCPKHRALLGVKYCPSRKCQHPLHGCRKGKVSRGVNLKMSKEIKEIWDVQASVTTECKYGTTACLGFLMISSDVRE